MTALGLRLIGGRHSVIRGTAKTIVLLTRKDAGVPITWLTI